jgi:hypothetical protein
LLSDHGEITRSWELDLGFVQIIVSSGMTLPPDEKAKLIAERKATRRQGG